MRDLPAVVEGIITGARVVTGVRVAGGRAPSFCTKQISPIFMILL